jgi:alkanesulfonate monooxygenase SsuD/methylene tetrahydromethanopterin reductase-like flavin-dependent oxidoreductase (luciferase family)
MQVGYYHSGNPARMIERIARAEKAGFDSAWVGDHFAFWFPGETYLETWSALSAAATATRKIKLGSGVIDPFRRNPALIAQSAATLDILSGGRAILGIGGGEPMNISPYGIKWEKPISRLRETIEAVRMLWRSSMTAPVSYSGEFTKLDSAFLQARPIQNGTMPIYVAGSAKKALRLAGELGDGWYAYVHSARTFQEDLKEVIDGAKLAGKSAEDIDTVAWFMCAVDRDSEKARETVHLPAAMELILAYDKLERLGYSKDIPERLALKHIIMNKSEIDSLYEDAKKVPFDAIRETAIFGTPDECIATIEKFAKAEAKHVVVVLLGNDLDGSFDLFQKQIIPHLHSFN